MEPALNISRRADLTFKFNARAGRHGWLRLTPAYSVRIVHDLMSRHPQAMHVLDPFCGTGTTPLCAAYDGRPAAAVEINPFLVWFAKVKVGSFDDGILDVGKKILRQISSLIKRNVIPPSPAPAIHDITRWWAPSNLEFLCRLKAVIDGMELDQEDFRDLLKIAFCRTMIGLSNAAFNHQSMSFKSEGSGSAQGLLFPKEVPLDNFQRDAEFILAGARENPPGPATIISGDSRKIEELTGERFDLVITSPPYPNRISYIRELRPYMYWLNFLREAREAGEADWKAIGGTWGIATSRLMSWKASADDHLPDYFGSIVEKIRSSKEKNGDLLSNYIHKYFVDVRSHINSLTRVLSRGASVYYIVGNSTFYGVEVPTQKIYHDLMLRAGFSGVEISLIRKRNSKKELFEYIVSAVY
jgi:DNA modification methylase